MPSAIFILLSGGLLLSAAIPKANSVGRNWLIALSVLSILLSGAGAIIRTLTPFEGPAAPAFFLRIQAYLIALTVAAAALHLATLAFGWPRVCRGVAVLGCFIAILAGSNLLHHAMLNRGTAVAFPPKAFSMMLQTLSAAGAAALPGLAFAVALFPLLGVTTPETSALTFRRLYRILLGVLSVRAIVSVGGVILLAAVATTDSARPFNGGLVVARWVVGLVVPGVLAMIAYRRAVGGRVLSAAALLLIGATSAMNGEAMALVLLPETGLPF